MSKKLENTNVHSKGRDSISGMPKTVSLTHAGIRMHATMRYASAELHEIRRLNADGMGQVLVEVRCNEHDLGYINVKNPATKKFIKVHESNQRYSAGMTLRQHKKVLRHARKNKSKVTLNELIERARALKAFIDQHVRVNRAE